MYLFANIWTCFKSNIGLLSSAQEGPQALVSAFAAHYVGVSECECGHLHPFIGRREESSFIIKQPSSYSLSHRHSNAWQIFFIYDLNHVILLLKVLRTLSHVTLPVQNRWWFPCKTDHTQFCCLIWNVLHGSAPAYLSTHVSSPPQHQPSFLPGCLLPDHKTALLILTPQRSLCLCRANLSSGKSKGHFWVLGMAAAFVNRPSLPWLLSVFLTSSHFFCWLNCLPLERKPPILSFHVHILLVHLQSVTPECIHSINVYEH